jgi:hypothetical protein
MAWNPRITRGHAARQRDTPSCAFLGSAPPALRTQASARPEKTGLSAMRADEARLCLRRDGLIDRGAHLTGRGGGGAVGGGASSPRGAAGAGLLRSATAARLRLVETNSAGDASRG